MTREPKKWTVTDVADRFEEAAQTLHRLPRVGVQGYFNAMPQVIRTAAEVLQEEKLPMRMGPPSADAISRMEEVLDWIWWLDDEDERRLVWLRAERVIWKRICWRLGCGRTKGMADVDVCAAEDCHTPQCQAGRALKCSNKKTMDRMNKNRHP